MGIVDTVVALAYLLAAVAFVVGLHLMNSPATARKGNQLSSAGMIVAVVATLAKVVNDGTITATGWAVLGAGTAVGAAAGLPMARRVKMTAIPQLVSLFNAAGGGAAALIAVAGFVRLVTLTGSPVSTRIAVATVLDVIIGAVTFSGSLVAAGKLQGWVSGEPVVFPGARIITAVLAAVAVVGSGYLLAGTDSIAVLIIVVCAALVFGITMVMPIGGADMPVVISMLNSFTGLAVAADGFAINNLAMVVAGTLVGSSGTLLTLLMCKAMNRPVTNVLFGAFGSSGGAGAAGASDLAGKTVKSIQADEAALLLSYAQQVVIVPGYGMAVAQAQHQVRELSDELGKRGIEVRFAIHPVAGRMPGHMNVLLAEANVPYDQLVEMEAINPTMDRVDVCLVIGANDVVNPAAREDKTSPIYGMPIIDADRAKTVIVMKRSMAAGFAGIENLLFYKDNTRMLFGDAKASLTALIAAVKAS